MICLHTSFDNKIVHALFTPRGLFCRIDSSRNAASQFDVNAAHRELVGVLTNFIRIDTSVTAGNGAEYLKTFLDGSKRPLLLMGHIDVVGVEREKWTVDPFGGEPGWAGGEHEARGYKLVAGEKHLLV